MADMRAEPLSLRAEHISWAAENRLIVDSVSLLAPAGAITGLLGPNGAGKSSLIRVISGTKPPNSGAVTLFAPGYSVDFLALPRRERARVVAVVEQDANTDLPLSVMDAVMLGRIPHRSLLSGESDTDRYLAAQSLARTNTEHLAKRQFATLSGGERQRVHLARALTQEPKILMLDEPTNHLDIKAQLDTLALMQELAHQGITIIAALHDLNLAASTCDHIVLMSKGKVAADGTPAEVLVPEIIDPIYGVKTTALTDPITGRPVLTFQRAASAT